MLAMVCPLCGLRRARRACPALGKQICAVCCGTKRLVEIQCPSDCVYLAVSREHPPAAVVRGAARYQLLVASSAIEEGQLFFLIDAFLLALPAPGFTAHRRRRD
jgi:hypothetical protein